MVLLALQEVLEEQEVMDHLVLLALREGLVLLDHLGLQELLDHLV